jgi:uncharacterized protein
MSVRSILVFFALTAAAAAADPVFTALPGPYETRNPPVNWAATGPDSLTLSAGPGANWFVTPWGGERTDTAPTLLVRPQGNFSLNAKISLQPISRWDSGCLVLLTDADNWAKLCLENAAGDGRLSVAMVVNRGRSDDGYTDFFAVDNAAYLRVSRSGSAFFFNASHDGKNWTMFRAFTLGGDFSQLRTGLIAQSPSGNGMTVTFSDIHYGVNEQ